MAVSDPVGADALSHALQHAVGLLREEQLDGAEAALTDLLRRWPAQPDALHFLACCATPKATAKKAWR